ncbi:unnamed protein product (macronuclear) [Paramecium tetraurelia]|uniref:Thioredoxin domain-containing protein n=1 Tax=Paramecium tetraurelia TaxID=5888 RepID=A0CLM8_PARTE|nr:uncharacterized protein GSPATT00008244001 [Paramecium tetraurelia]CAK71695.1 unnamed protein product [Paramecium tetraurelia]|eukprot:XP_001439092.1 hypothetical protein (macronuclear) [Paramecium tetraurelia strain d4-2]
MKYLLTLLFFSLVLGQQVPEENGVLILSDQNFEYVLKKYEFVLVDFYAHWCGHCHHLAPVFASSARQVRNQNVQFAKINCPQYEHLCRKYQVTGFPTLKLFGDGQLLMEYQGDRTEKAIVDWMRKKTNKGSVEAKSLDQLKKFSESPNLVMVFFGEQKESYEFMQYYQFSQKNKHIPALHTFNQNFANEMRAQVPSIVVYKPYDERKAAIFDNFEISYIEQFVKKHSYPVLMNFDIQTAKRIFKGDQPTLILVQNSQTSQAEKHLRLALSKIKDQILICIANTDNKYGLRLMQYFGIQNDYLPQIVAFNPISDSFNLLSEITKDGIINFTQSFLGLQQRSQKSDL